MSKQLTFPRPTTVTRKWPDGREERIRYGHFESVMIVKENGWPVDRTKILIVPTHPVTDVECEDGSLLIFDEPLYVIEKRERGDSN
jgi:hypothetical protein